MNAKISKIKAKTTKKTTEKNNPKKDKAKPGDQLQLIDVQPKNKAEILKAAEEYKKVRKVRIEFLEKEKTAKKEVLTLVRKAKMHPFADGSIAFMIDGVKISVTPRDELVQVKYKDEPEEEYPEDGEPCFNRLEAFGNGKQNL